MVLRISLSLSRGPEFGFGGSDPTRHTHGTHGTHAHWTGAARSTGTLRVQVRAECVEGVTGDSDGSAAWWGGVWGAVVVPSEANGLRSSNTSDHSSHVDVSIYIHA